MLFIFERQFVMRMTLFFSIFRTRVENIQIFESYCKILELLLSLALAFRSSGTEHSVSILQWVPWLWPRLCHQASAELQLLSFACDTGAWFTRANQHSVCARREPKRKSKLRRSPSLGVDSLTIARHEAHLRNAAAHHACSHCWVLLSP